MCQLFNAMCVSFSIDIDIFFILASDDSFSDENIELTIISKWKAELLLKNLWKMSLVKLCYW